MCLFCKIVSGDVPCYRVYEDNDVLAFLDIAPASNGHVLVIPKVHYVNMEDLPEDVLCCLMKVVKKVGKVIMCELNVEGYNILQNNNEAAGQIVPHIHFHIIPRVANDGLNVWRSGKYENNEAEEVLKKIKIN